MITTAIRSRAAALAAPLFLSLLAAPAYAAGPSMVGSPIPARAAVQASLAKLPLLFEANQGQTSRQARFLSHGPGYNLFLASGEAVLSLWGGQYQGYGALSTLMTRQSKTPPAIFPG